MNNLPANVGDAGSIPGPGRFHVLRNDYVRVLQLLSLCLEPVFHNRRSHHKEPLHHNQRVPLLAVTRESPRAATKSQHSHCKTKKLKLYPLYSNWEAGSKWWCRTLGSPRPANSSKLQLHGLSSLPNGKDPAHSAGDTGSSLIQEDPTCQGATKPTCQPLSPSAVVTEAHAP